MCFSANASFLTAGFLSLLGLMSYRCANHTRSLVPLGVVPLIFALQQFLEGLVWLCGAESGIGYGAGYFFFVIAYAFWPLWIPFAVYQAESHKPQLKILMVYVIGGIAWFLSTVTSMVLYQFSVTITDHIVYALAVPFDIATFLVTVYVIIVTGPFFISTVPFARLFGLVLLTAFCISYWRWYAAYASVWCFFAALLSCLLLLMIAAQKKSLQRAATTGTRCR